MLVQTWIPVIRPNTAQKAAAKSHATRRRVMALVCRRGGRKGRGVQRMVSGVQRKRQFEPSAMRRRERRQRRAPQRPPENESVLAGQARQYVGVEAVAVRPSQEAVRGENAQI